MAPWWGTTTFGTVDPSAFWIWSANNSNDIICRVHPFRCFLNDRPCFYDWNFFNPAAQPLTLPLPDNREYLTVGQCAYTPCCGSNVLQQQIRTCCSETGQWVTSTGPCVRYSSSSGSSSNCCCCLIDVQYILQNAGPRIASLLQNSFLCMP